jgi:hypothetical protein
MESIDHRLDAETTGWKPAAGDKLVGVIVDIDERDAGYGPYPVVTILSDDDSKQYAFHGFHTVARSELAKAKPQVGEQIGVKYLGKPEGKKYESYRVTVDRDEAREQLDWERIGSEAAAEQHQDGLAEDSVHADEDPEGSGADDDIPF